MTNDKNSNQSERSERETAAGTTTPVGSAAPAESGGQAQAGEPLQVEEAGCLTAEDIEQLKAKAAKADEHWDRFLRQTAEFDNYRKRMARDRQDAVVYANQGLLQKLVTVMDNFDMALMAANQAQSPNLEAMKTGINMIYSQLKATLTEAGLEEISALNQPFNPNLHEAVSQKETADAPEGQVVEQLRKGYKLRDRLLRPATVIVAKKPGA